MQNAYMYSWGIVLNVALCLAQAPQVLDGSDFGNLDRITALTIVSGATGGITVSLMLKHLDTALKEFTGGVEMATVALAQWPLLGIPPKSSLIASSGMVALALHLYSKGKVGDDDRGHLEGGKHQLPLAGAPPEVELQALKSERGDHEEE